MWKVRNTILVPYPKINFIPFLFLNLAFGGEEGEMWVANVTNRANVDLAIFLIDLRTFLIRISATYEHTSEAITIEHSN